MQMTNSKESMTDPIVGVIKETDGPDDGTITMPLSIAQKLNGYRIFTPLRSEGILSVGSEPNVSTAPRTTRNEEDKYELFVKSLEEGFSPRRILKQIKERLSHTPGFGQIRRAAANGLSFII